MNERIKKRWCVCILAVRKKDILPFPTTWTNQEDIMLSEISQRKTNTVWFHSYMESKKKSRTLETVEWWLPGASGREIGRCL